MSYNTRAASCGKYHIKFSRLNQQRNSLAAMFWRESMELNLPSRVCNLPKPAFKKGQFAKLVFAALEGEEDYIEAPKWDSSIINLYII